METIPTTSVWIYAFFGLIFQTTGIKNISICVLTMFLHIFYYFISITSILYFKEADVDEGLAAQVLQVCRFAAATCIILKFLSMYLASKKLEQISIKITVLRNRVGYHKKRCNFLKSSIFFLTSSIIVTYSIIYMYSTSNMQFDDVFSWSFSLMRDSSECDFFWSTCRNSENLLVNLNRRLEEISQQLNDFKSNNSGAQLVMVDPDEQKNTSKMVSLLKDLSNSHWRLINIINETGDILLFSVTLQLTRHLVDIVTESYFCMSILIYSLKQSFALILLSLIYTATMCIIVVHSWTSCSFQANRTVIILHDIWNKYTRMKGIDKKLLYLQFISMRFLSSKLKFTAYGLFPLDWSFLHKIVASATTYIIVLIQLKN